MFFWILISLIGSAVSQLCANGTVSLPPDHRCALVEMNFVFNDYFEDEFACQDLGGHLLSIQSAFANWAFVNYANAARVGDNVFLGADNHRGVWKWIDGSSMAYTNWAPGHPTGVNKCLTVKLADGTWHSADCQQQIPFGCEVTSPGCPGNWTLYDKNCYSLVNPDRPIQYNDARKACVAEGADLASIHSAEENMFLEGFAAGALDNPWIGLNWNGTFSWTDGSEVNFAHTADHVGVPSIFDFEIGGMLPGYWNGYPVTRSMGDAYICKKSVGNSAKVLEKKNGV